MSIRHKSREFVIQTFYALLYSDPDTVYKHLDYLNYFKPILENLLINSNIPINHQIYTYAEHLIAKIIPLYEELDSIISSCIEDRSIEQIGNIELIIIRLATYEMIYENTPPAVMINEAIELAKKYCSEKSPSLINALLDKIRLTHYENGKWKMENG